MYSYLYSFAKEGWLRSFVTDYVVPLMVVVSTGLSSVPSKVSFGIPSSLQHWTISKDLLSVPPAYKFAAIIPAVMVAGLYFSDHSFASKSAQQKEFNLENPSAYHYDETNEINKQPVSASRELKPLKDAIMKGGQSESGSEPNDHKFDPEKHIEAYLPVRVNEQRVSSLFQCLLVGFCLFIMPIIRMVRTSVLMGYSVYMDIDFLPGNQFFERILLLFVTPSRRYKVLQEDHAWFVDSVPFREIAQMTRTPPNQDLISRLTEDIIVEILERLSTDEAVRSGILSKSWLYTWANITKLDVTNSYFPSNESFIGFIDKFFQFDNGPIFEFLIPFFDVPRKTFERWISMLSRRNIQSFKITKIFVCHVNRIQIPSDFYLCHSLEIIDLYKCEIHVPSTFTGFKLLKKLSLSFVTIDSVSFERLISNSPSLEMLELNFIYTDERVYNNFLKIRAPNLKNLLIRNVVLETYLDVPSLVHARFEIYDGSGSKVISALSRVPNIEKLDIVVEDPEFFIADNSWKKRSMKFNNLKEINIRIKICYPDDVSCALFLFERAPNFQTLRLEIESEKNTRMISDVISLLDAKSNEGSILMKLDTVIVHGSSASNKLVRAFLKFVLLTAPLLKKVGLSKSHWKYEGYCRLFMKLHGLSNKIEIILLQDY